MSVYLGRPGSLVALPSVGLSVQPQVLRVSQGDVTIGGGRRRDYAPGVLRSWVLRWNVLDRALYSAVEAFYSGLNGPGPYAFLDSGRTNLLTPNQSGSTSVSNDTAGWSVAGVGGAIASSATLVERGPRTLAWSLPAAAAGSRINVLGPNSDWPGIPVVPGRSYRWQTRLRLAGADTSVQVQPKADWLNAAGGIVSTDGAGTIPTIVDTAWTSCVLNGPVAPAGAVYVLPYLAVIAATVSATTTVYVDTPQLAMPDLLDDGTVWRAGLGVPRVSLPGLDDNTWWASLHKTGLILEEVS